MAQVHHEAPYDIRRLALIKADASASLILLAACAARPPCVRGPSAPTTPFLANPQPWSSRP